MKKILFVMMTALLFFSACGEEDLYEKYGPEILFYEYEAEGVKTTEFNSITLGADKTEFTLFARVSAPFKLKEIKVFREESLIKTINDFSAEKKPTEYFLKQAIENIAVGTTQIRVEATDLDGKLTIRTFRIIK
ncbi:MULTISPECIES: hypothetical protein [unclassified Dysgonomonas]|uniref:hypothetical protein n=1 Tax=unclassified Dysgonomonas TaxID=2630389 RepID=UPI0024765843|nr:MULTISPECIES: hypothetical protein [unclassified Dysgonomonas]